MLRVEKMQGKKDSIVRNPAKIAERRVEMSGGKMREIRTSLGIDQVQFGLMFGFSRQTVSDWECERDPIPTVIAKVTTLLDKKPYLIYEFHLDFTPSTPRKGGRPPGPSRLGQRKIRKK